MKDIKKRRSATFFSLLAAFGNFAIIAITIKIGTFEGFLEIFSITPHLVFVLLTGLISLVISLMLLTKTELRKKELLTALIISSLVFVVAVVQMSVELGFVLLWPWSLYKLYRGEISSQDS